MTCIFLLKAKTQIENWIRIRIGKDNYGSGKPKCSIFKVYRPSNPKKINEQCVDFWQVIFLPSILTVIVLYLGLRFLTGFLHSHSNSPTPLHPPQLVP